jgi:hypothetical protein
MQEGKQEIIHPISARKRGLMISDILIIIISSIPTKWYDRENPIRKQAIPR